MVEWANFLFDFLGHIVKVHKYNTTIMKHILIRLYNIVGFTPTAPLCLPQPRTPPPPHMVESRVCNLKVVGPNLVAIKKNIYKNCFRNWIRSPDP